jgi:hypothetical protein
MRHFASRAFWEAYERLPAQVRELADKNYALLKQRSPHGAKRNAGFLVAMPPGLRCASSELRVW